MTYKHGNGRLVPRGNGGQFRKATMQDVGIGGICKVCNHFLLRHYNGNENERPLNPAGFRYRCFTCEPLTEEEKVVKQAYEDSLPKPRTFEDIFKELAEREDKE